MSVRRKYPPCGRAFSDYQRYKVRTFRKKKATKIGLFIDRLLTIIFNLCCSAVGGIFSGKRKTENGKLLFLDERRETRENGPLRLSRGHRRLALFAEAPHAERALFGHKKRSSSELLVPRIGLEPTRLSALAPETSASTISPSGHCDCKGI